MINVYWADDSKTLLIREMNECWTWDEYHNRMDDMKGMLCSVAHAVVIIVDYRNTSQVPKDALNQIYKANQNIPENVLALIIVSNSRWLQTVTAILNRLMTEPRPQTFYFRSMARALKQAQHLIKPPKKRKPRRSPVPS